MDNAASAFLPDADSLALLAEHGSDMISVHALDGTYRAVGGACTRLFAWRPDQLVDQPAVTFVHPADLEGVTAQDEAMRARGEGKLAYRFRRADGGWSWVEVRARIVDRGDGAEPKIVCVTRDVTERQQSEQSLREAFALLSALVEGTTDHVFVKNFEGRYALVNEAAARFMGRPVASILGKTDRDLFPPEVAERVLERDHYVLETGRTITYETESWVEGAPRAWSATKGPMRDERGAVSGLFGVMREITEQKRAERLLQEQAEELRSLSLVDELTGLYNRRGFVTLAQQQLATARRLGKKVVLLFVDLDGLKPINDQFGHEAGDRAIAAAAGLLRACFRESDVIARLGGDEFAVAAMEVSPGAAGAFGTRLEHARGEFNARSGERWELAFSLGAVESDPGQQQALADLLRRADEEMYAQKRLRRLRR